MTMKVNFARPFDESDPAPKRLRYERLRGQLAYERGTFLSTWRELGDFVAPRRPRFTITDANKGDRRNQRINDTTPVLAHRTLRSGMMGGITSPARPWFRLTTGDPDLSEFGRVKDWLYFCTQVLHNIFLKSNLYNSLPIIYGDTGLFGTSAMLLEENFPSFGFEDPHDVIRTYPFSIGSYYLANDDRMRVAVFMRELQFTVRQMIGKFAKLKPNGRIDWQNISPWVKNQWEIGQPETWVQVIHCVEPNPDYRPQSALAQHKRFRSVYYELGIAGTSTNQYDADIQTDKFLRVSGYDRFPVLAPRWEIGPEDVYGVECPGVDAIGDIKQLQVMQKRMVQAIEKMVNPPLVGPSALQNQKVSVIPGDTTYSDEREGTKGLRPIYEVNPRTQELAGVIEKIQERIDEAFYKDLFLMMLESDRRQITAREIDERKEEQLLALGPVLEQLNQDLLDPLIDTTFDIASRQGLIPPPPPEVQGQTLKVEYLSIMAQAQKLVGMQGVQTFTGFLQQVVQMDPNAIDKVDTDHLLEVVGDATSTPPGVVRPEDQVQAIRQQKQQAAAQQAQMEAIQKGAGAAKDLSQADTSGDNALTQLTQATEGGHIA